MKKTTIPARNAASKLVDFEKRDGLNHEFLSALVEDTSSEAEARNEVADFIDRETNLPDLIKAVEWLLYGCLTENEVITLAKGNTTPQRVQNRARETRDAREFAANALAIAKGTKR
jgi:hypothetical protein